MLHEGASVEGKMHMISEAPRDASTTIRGSASLRGETGADANADATPRAAGTSLPTAAQRHAPTSPAPVTTGSTAPAKPTPAVTPSSAAKPVARPAHIGGTSSALSGDPTARSSAASTAPSSTAPTSPAPATQMTVPGLEDPGTPRRSPVAEALRLETLLVAPRTMNTGTRYGGTTGTTRPSSVTSSTSRARNGTTTAF
jgi:hypothetical protein